MSTHTVERLRIRPGPGPEAAARARRLVRVAHDHLGPELDRALADVAGETRVEIGRVEVRLPVDPAELDDATLAALWASLIRDAIASALPATAGRGSDESLEEAALALLPEDRRELAAMLLAWARDGLAPTGSRRTLITDLAASRDALAEVVAVLPVRWRPRARMLVEGRLQRLATEESHEPGRASERSTSPATDAQPAPGEHPSSTREVPSAARTTVAGQAYSPLPGAPSARSDADRPDLEAAALPADLVPASAYGGLVLLHHRLVPYVRRAVAAEPALDPVSVRLTALALVADPEALPVEDLLVRLLAGATDWQLRTPAPIAPIPVTSAGEEAADDLLRAFAGDLPGFTGSSPGFVREQWVRRPAILLDDSGTVLIRLGRRPLDLVLDRLPYPTGALRLPWTPPLLVGWEAS